MRFIMAQPSTIKFKWQCEVAVNNLLKLDVSPSDIFLLFLAEPEELDVVGYLKNKYHVNAFEFNDTRTADAKKYIPSIKPYLMWRFFSDHPEDVPYAYMYQDSDVVYRELPDFSTMKLSEYDWYGSDTSSYLGSRYLDSKGPHLLKDMADQVGVSEEVVRSLSDTSIGAQIVMMYPKASYWELSYKASYRLYNYLDKVEPSYIQYYKFDGRPNEYPVQKWTSQMWTDLWIPASYNVRMHCSDELQFSWATDSMDDVMKYKLYHDAGIDANVTDRFYKGAFSKVEPFGRDFSYVDPKSASAFYVKQIEDVSISN